MTCYFCGLNLGFKFPRNRWQHIQNKICRLNLWHNIDSLMSMLTCAIIRYTFVWALSLLSISLWFLQSMSPIEIRNNPCCKAVRHKYWVLFNFLFNLIFKKSVLIKETRTLLSNLLKYLCFRPPFAEEMIYP